MHLLTIDFHDGKPIGHESRFLLDPFPHCCFRNRQHFGGKPRSRRAHFGKQSTDPLKFARHFGVSRIHIALQLRIAIYEILHSANFVAEFMRVRHRFRPTGQGAFQRGIGLDLRLKHFHVRFPLDPGGIDAGKVPFIFVRNFGSIPSVRFGGGRDHGGSK